MGGTGSGTRAIEIGMVECMGFTRSGTMGVTGGGTMPIGIDMVVCIRVTG